MEYLYGYILLGIGLVLASLAQFYVTSSYRKYSKVSNKNQISGLDAARKVLDSNGLQNVKVEVSNGLLSDHYDPRSKTVRLSESVYNDKSIAAASVAAHECGHALQDKDGYLFLKFRSFMFPIVNFSSYAGYIIILIGAFTNLLNLIWIGIGLEFVILLFQIITLPVEINASRRALVELKKNNILVEKELTGGKKMLTAAASTYVASIAVAILEILRLIFMFVRRDD